MSTSSKLKKQAEKERKAFKSFEGRKKEERHIRLTNDMLMHENYLSLGCAAKVLYNYMKLWAYGCHDFKSKGTFEYTVSLAMKVLRVSNKTAINAWREERLQYFTAENERLQKQIENTKKTAKIKEPKRLSEKQCDRLIKRYSLKRRVAKRILIWLFDLIGIVGFVFLSLFLVKTIWQSDLPEWFKIWWLVGG